MNDPELYTMKPRQYNYSTGNILEVSMNSVPSHRDANIMESMGILGEMGVSKVHGGQIILVTGRSGSSGFLLSRALRVTHVKEKWLIIAGSPVGYNSWMSTNFW